MQSHDLSREIRKAEIREDFKQFLTVTMPPGWQCDARHHLKWAETINRCAKGAIDRFWIKSPPRHGKTQIAVVRAMVYMLLRNPANRYLMISHSVELAEQSVRFARQICEMVGISPEGRDRSYWFETAEGGGIRGVGIEGSLTGFGYHGIIADDLVKGIAEANSQAEREKIEEKVRFDLLTRIQPGGFIGLVATPWHHADVCAQLTQGDDAEFWEVVGYPAIAVADDDLGRKPGDALWPESGWDEKALARKRLEIGERAWNSLYQVNPTPKEGLFFRVDKINMMDSVPPLHEFVTLVRYWDCASSANSGDYTAGVLGGVHKSGQFWFLDLVHGQWDTSERNRIMRETAERDDSLVKPPQIPVEEDRDGESLGSLMSSQKRVTQMRAQELGSSGKDARYWFGLTMAGFSWKVDREHGPKGFRAEPLADSMGGGLVYMPKGQKWVAGFVYEYQAFDPDGNGHDDMVDAGAGVYRATYKVMAALVAPTRAIECLPQREGREPIPGLNAPDHVAGFDETGAMIAPPSTRKHKQQKPSPYAVW